MSLRIKSDNMCGECAYFREKANYLTYPRYDVNATIRSSLVDYECVRVGSPRSEFYTVSEYESACSLFKRAEIECVCNADDGDKHSPCCQLCCAEGVAE